MVYVYPVVILGLIHFSMRRDELLSTQPVTREQRIDLDGSRDELAWHLDW